MSDESIFACALAKTDPAERAAYLDEACGADADLRRGVEELLQAHGAAGRFLERPAAAPRGTAEYQPADGVSPREGPGTVIGPYKLLQQIGEGGMGVVYMAEQEKLVRRRVALKVIKPGMDSKQVIARFEAERQALAMMDHLHIAKVLDAGTTETGRPYFVMELVRGVPITKFCDQEHLTPRERLELFVPVCQAVQHAHQKGVIHRDLKPSNILVTLYDGKPVPKIIDFGVAKALHTRLTDRTMFTEFGAVVGTLEYMSPEQAEMSGLDVDTRSDIYALGVLLYELLTGTTPFDRKRLRRAALAEAMRIIHEEEPPRSSTRLSQSGESLASIAAARKTEPAKLPKLVRGELDWIVMKCLEKDRERRYESANGLARDVQRYLADEPVEACPPSAGYRLRKFARKHKQAIGLAAAFAALLAAGAVVSTALAVRALRAERTARVAEGDAKRDRDAARQAEADIRAVTECLVKDLLIVDQPERQGPGSGIKVTVKRAMDAAASKLAELFADQPKEEAEARQALGEQYLFMEDYPAAEEQFRRALALRRQVLGREHEETLHTQYFLAFVLEGRGKEAEVIPLYEGVLPLWKVKFGPDALDTLVLMDNLARLYQGAGRWSEAEPLLRECLAIRARKYPEEWSTFNDRSLLGGALAGQKKYAEAEPLLVEGYEGLKARAKAIPAAQRAAHLTEALERLVQLYDGWGKPDAAAKWRKELEAARPAGEATRK
jgi:serine/threonine protein kinase/tetratricopeptide (TPR) repeat protein